MKVLCFGSLNIDYTYKVDHFVRKGETLSSEALQMFPGGKGLNQSVALAKAGAEVYHAGAVGEDGLFLLEVLKKYGVDTKYTDVRRDIRTGHAIIQSDREGDNCILLYGGANQAITKEQIDRVFGGFSKGDYLLLQNEISELPAIMERARSTGMKIVLNPSPMNEKILALPLNYVDLLILNEVEAGQILNEDAETDESILMGKLRERFPQAAVVLTLGSRGSLCADEQVFHVQKAYRVKAVDTTAAGDTFTGFLIGSIMEGKTIPEAMETAAKASAIAVTRMGAAPSVPTRKEVEEF